MEAVDFRSVFFSDEDDLVFYEVKLVFLEIVLICLWRNKLKKAESASK